MGHNGSALARGLHTENTRAARGRLTDYPRRRRAGFTPQGFGRRLSTETSAGQCARRCFRMLNCQAQGHCFHHTGRAARRSDKLRGRGVAKANGGGRRRRPQRWPRRRHGGIVGCATVWQRLMVATATAAMATAIAQEAMARTINDKRLRYTPCTHATNHSWPGTNFLSKL